MRNFLTIFLHFKNFCSKISFIKAGEFYLIKPLLDSCTIMIVLSNYVKMPLKTIWGIIWMCGGVWVRKKKKCEGWGAVNFFKGIVRCGNNFFQKMLFTSTDAKKSFRIHLFYNMKIPCSTWGRAVRHLCRFLTFLSHDLNFELFIFFCIIESFHYFLRSILKINY